MFDITWSTPTQNISRPNDGIWEISELPTLWFRLEIEKLTTCIVQSKCRTIHITLFCSTIKTH